MKKEPDSIDDLKAIRKIMEESSRFLSLSGLSGVFAGVTAIAGALIAYSLIKHNDSPALRWQLIAVAGGVLIISVLFAIYFSLKKARREGKSFWTPVSRRLLTNLLIPLITGGIFVILLMLQNHIQLIIPCFLIFYGLALVNAGKFTFGEVYYLGIFEIILGLMATVVPGYGLIFWILGFGVLHIIYGLVMFRKYE
jgi:MFS family permease